MVRTDAAVLGTHYYCYPLSSLDDRDEQDILAFTPTHPRGAGLVTYLRQLALPEELSGMMRTYLVRDNDNDELAGYFSLKAGSPLRTKVQVPHESSLTPFPVWSLQILQ